ncbi:MAG: carboxypeptidase regulatory-like domain-containing protein, partial [Planctomycetia bacterium]|nr:carboxypeptidase regulatory-like domain-containing protein [Planctomycetia bacterium]
KQLEMPDGQSFGGRRIRFVRDDSVAADAAGTIRTPLPLERSGKYSLEISADGFLPFRTPFIQPSGSDPESLLGEFTLERARSATGLVLDTAGKPVAGVTVSAHGIPPDRHSDQPVIRVQSDAMGRFSLSPLHPATAVVTVRADGYRPTGAVISDSGEDVRITIYRNEETVAEQDRVTVPDRNDSRESAGIALLENILPHVRDSNYFHSEALKLMSRVAPNKLAGELTQTTSATTIVEALVLLGEFEEANAQAEQIESSYSRGFARFKIIDACPDEQLKPQLIAAALIDAKTIQEPDRRAVVLAGVAERLTVSGQHDQARALLTESLAQFQQLPDKEWAGFAKGHFAERLARYDFDAAVAMLDGMEPRDKARHAGNIAHAMAAIEPEKAEQIVATSDATNLVVAFRIRACYRMAAVDLDRAERIRQGTKRSGTFAKEHTLGVMAMAIREQKPDKSRELLRQAWSELEATGSQTNGYAQGGVYRFGVALALLSYAESIDPDNLTDYFWRTIALYPGSQGSSWQPDEQQIEDLQRQAVLALAFGLYQREPAMCRRIMEPAFAYWSNPQHLQDHSFYRKTATFTAMALADPAQAGQWAIDARDMMPEKNRTLIPQPWLTVLTTLCADRQAIHDMLGDEVFTRWTIDKYD